MKFNNSIAALANRQPRSEFNSKATYNPKLSCYYCGKAGHRHKAQDKRTWLCPDKLNGKSPCEGWSEYHKLKGYLSDKPSEQQHIDI